MFHPVPAPSRVSESRPFAWRHVKRVVGAHSLAVGCLLRWLALVRYMAEHQSRPPTTSHRPPVRPGDPPRRPSLCPLPSCLLALAPPSSRAPVLFLPGVSFPVLTPSPPPPPPLHFPPSSPTTASPLRRDSHRNPPPWSTSPLTFSVRTHHTSDNTTTRQITGMPWLTSNMPPAWARERGWPPMMDHNSEYSCFIKIKPQN